MKNLLFCFFFIVLSAIAFGQNKPVYSMSKEKAIIEEPKNIMAKDSSFTSTRQPVSMYKNVVFDTDSLPVTPRDTVKNDGSLPKPVMRKEKEN